MIATNSPCLTHDQLRDLTAGRLPGDRFARLLEHLDACADCQRRAQDIGAPEDSLVAALASPSTADPHAAEADCAAVLHASSRQHYMSSESSAPPVDQLGPYRLIRPLGSGGMGAVFLARHTRLRRECAIKLLPRDRGFDAAWRDRFDREMAAVAALDDPHVVAASDAGEVDGWHFLVMEYLDGLDLSRLAGRMGPLGVADACELVRQSAVGLAHVHSAGLVHRDIKPSNLMLTRDGMVKILDLGLVLSDHDPLPADDRLTTVGQLMGTLAYMAPEQLVDSTAVDHRADLYALGATLYRMLAGEPPHGLSRGIAPLVIAKTQHPAPDLGRHRGDLPESLVTLVRDLLDRDPERRPKSAAAIAAALQPHTAGAEPKRLISEALRKRPTSDESTSGSPIPLAVTGGKGAPPPRRPWSWKTGLAAAAGLPLLLLAGIVLVVVTDRGQLVIESEAAGLNISVARGEEVVEELQLTTGENRITLRSGTYTVTMDAEADGLELSDQQATVTRGGETVLHVRREPLSPASPLAGDSDAGPRFRGKAFDHWLAVLETERDVETITEAMKAVVELSRNEASKEDMPGVSDQQRAEAAAAMLRAARRYGGMQWDNTGGEKFGLQDSSSRFMGYLLSLYPALLPNPGLAEISRELEVGNEKSAMAAIFLLYYYAYQTVLDELYRPDFKELERWSETPKGRVKLRELSEHVDQAVERLGGYASPTIPPMSAGTPEARAVGLAYQTRLRLNELLDTDSFQDEAIAGRLRQSIENAAKDSKQVFEHLGNPGDSSTAWQQTASLSQSEVRAALEEPDASLAAWAIVPSLLMGYTGDPQVLLEQLRELAEEAPEATANAILTVLHQRGVMRPNMGGGGFGTGAFGDGSFPIAVTAQNEALLTCAVELVGKLTTKPEFALGVLQRIHQQLFKNGPVPDPISNLSDVLQSAIERLQARTNSLDAP